MKRRAYYISIEAYRIIKAARAADLRKNPPSLNAACVYWLENCLKLAVKFPEQEFNLDRIDEHDQEKYQCIRLFIPDELHQGLKDFAKIRGVRLYDVSVYFFNMTFWGVDYSEIK